MLQVGLRLRVRDGRKRWPSLRRARNALAAVQGAPAGVVRMVTRFACLHCRTCTRPTCCRCGRRRFGRLHHRRFERSGAAAVMTAVLEWSLTLCWRAFARRRSSPPNQPLALGGLLGDRSRQSEFGVSRPKTSIFAVPELGAPQNSLTIRELARAQNAAQLPRRLSSLHLGAPKCDPPHTSGRLGTGPKPDGAGFGRVDSGPPDGSEGGRFRPGGGRTRPVACSASAERCGSSAERPLLDTRRNNLTGRVGDKS